MFGLMGVARMAGQSVAGVQRPTVTLIYDEQFSTARSAPMASHPTTFAADVGNTKFYNNVNAYVSGGQLLFNGAPNCMVIDAAAARSRLAGRIHYCSHPIGTTADFQSFMPISLVGESPAANWWALQAGQPGIQFKGGAAGGDIRNVTGATDGNYQWKSKVTQNRQYEWAIIERDTAGSFTLVRIDGGDWQMITFEKTTSTAAKMHTRQISSGVTAIDRMCTAETSFIPTPLVQHSFASALTPSDGAGQPETGGSGTSAATVGSVQVSGSTLNMSADGTGLVVFDTGQTDVGISVDATIYDGSPVGVVLRYVDASNYLLVRLNSTADTIVIAEIVAGVETVLVTRSHNPGPTDTYNLADGAAIAIKAHIDGNLIRAGHTPGSLHDTFESYTTTRFAGSTTHGVMVSKGASVNSSKASNFVAFAQVQNLPAMENYP